MVIGGSNAITRISISLKRPIMIPSTILPVKWSITLKTDTIHNEGYLSISCGIVKMPVVKLKIVTKEEMVASITRLDTKDILY